METRERQKQIEEILEKAPDGLTLNQMGDGGFNLSYVHPTEYGSQILHIVVNEGTVRDLVEKGVPVSWKK